MKKTVSQLVPAIISLAGEISQGPIPEDSIFTAQWVTHWCDCQRLLNQAKDALANSQVHSQAQRNALNQNLFQ